MKETLAYALQLITANLRNHITDRKTFFIMSSVMFFQNILFFMLWVLLFEIVSSLNGWDLSNVALMFGIVCFSYGAYNVFFNGIRTLPYILEDGGLDSYLMKPRHPLFPILCRSTSSTAIGDLLFGPFLWIVFCDLSFSDWMMLSVACLFSTLLLVAAVTVVYSTSLWMKGNARFCEHLFEMLLIFTSVIIHGQPFLVKLIAFTVIPAGFISYLPVRLVSSFSWAEFGVLGLATILYGWFAIAFFNGGIKRYMRMEKWR